MRLTDLLTQPTPFLLSQEFGELDFNHIPDMLQHDPAVPGSGIGQLKGLCRWTVEQRSIR